MQRTRLAFWLAAALVAACGQVPDKLPNPVSAVTDEIASAARRVASNVSGSHLGFDTSEYPGDDAMRAWREGDSPYEWVGYYLPASCHKDDSWTGKRQTLTDMGWGLAVVYVGQQTWGQTPGAPRVITRWVRRRVRETAIRHHHRVTRYVTRRVAVRAVIAPRVLPGQSCSPHLVSSSQGTQEASDAIARAQAEGFPAGTVIFLDVEHMDFVPQRMRDYYKAWVARVLHDGRYTPGIYAHTANAATIYADVKGVFQAAGSRVDPPFWIAGSSGFAPRKPPTDVGHAFASVWQGLLDVVETRNGVSLKIDKSVASVPSPSQNAPVAAADVAVAAALR